MLRASLAMSAPLVNIDANPRQPASRPADEGSKIPTLPTVQQHSSATRRSPFSVRTTGSPYYTPLTAISKPTMSPSPMSRLPRKSTPTQSTVPTGYSYNSKPSTPRSGLPRARNSHRSNAKPVPDHLNTSKTISPLSYNKPLPSPPVAQIVNPTSPPKAQRTLVDAEAGTPTDEQWPILRPENTPQSESCTPSAFSVDIRQSQRSVSESSAHPRSECSETSVIKAATAPSQNVSLEKNATRSEDVASIHEKFEQMTEPREFSCIDPAAQPFHAFSTNTEVAIDSPLVCTKQNSSSILIPPRVSSKRNSLPSPEMQILDQLTKPTSALFQPVKRGSTKWPVLGHATDYTDNGHLNKKDLSSIQSRLLDEPEPVEAASIVGSNTEQTQYSPTKSDSSCSMAAASSLHEEPEIKDQGSVRVKRLSWQSPNNGSGPMLRIFADADAVLLGQDNSDHVCLSSAQQVSERNTRDRTIGTLAGRMSKQILLRMASSTGSRTSTPSSTETESETSKAIKVTPIRSMQPPRNSNSGNTPSKSPLMGTQAVQEAENNQDDFLPFQPRSCSSIEISMASSSSLGHSDAVPQQLMEDEEKGYVRCSYSQVAAQLSIKQEPSKSSTEVDHYKLPRDADEFSKKEPQPAIRKPPLMERTAQSPAYFRTKKSATTRSKTSPLLQPPERLKARVATSPANPVGLDSSRVAHSTLSQGVRLPQDPPSLEGTKLLADDLKPGLQQSNSKGAQATEKSAVDAAPTVKAKRSFRNVFIRRDPKVASQPSKKQNSKRASVAGSALTQRIRNSANFSKVSLSRPPAHKAETKEHATFSSDTFQAQGKENECQAALLALEAGSAMHCRRSEATAHPVSVNVIHKILERVTLMGEESPDRLRGLEIAEAILQAVECSQKARMSAEQARKHARDAELNAECAGIELKRLEKLCGPNFDDETMQAIKQLITEAGLNRPIVTSGI